MTRKTQTNRGNIQLGVLSLLLVLALSCKTITPSIPDNLSTPESANPAEETLGAPTIPGVSTPRVLNLQTTERWFLMGRPGGAVNTTGELQVGSIVISMVEPDYMFVPLGKFGLLASLDGGRSWTNIGVGSNIQQVIADTRDANTLYALSNGLMTISTDFGGSWNILGENRDMATIGVSNDGKLMYALSQNGFHVSNDHGKTWATSKPDTFPNVYGNWLWTSMSVDAQDSQIAYAIVDGLLFTTNNGGKDWTTPSLLSTVRVLQFFADQTLPGVAFAFTQERALYRTLDGGKSWGLIKDLNEYGKKVDAWLENAPKLLGAWNGVVYIRGASREGGTEAENSCGLALFISEDKGDSWNQLDHYPALSMGCGETECTHIALSMAVHPENPSVIYSIVNHQGGGGELISFLKSNDSGRTWEIQNPLPRPLHISTSIDGSILYVSGQQAFMSENGGETWRNITEQITSCEYDEFYDIAYGFRDRNVAFLNATPNFNSTLILMTDDGGKNWRELNLPLQKFEQAFAHVWVNPWNSDYIYLAQPNMLSTDGGNSWTEWTSLEGRLNAISIKPDDPNHVLFGVINGGLYFSSDGGKTVELRGLSADYSVYSLAYDSSNTNRVYAVFESSNQISLGHSDDEGKSWEIVSDLGNIGTTLDYGYYYARFYGSVFVDPRTPTTLYLARGNIYRSVDGGISWELFETGMTAEEEITEMSMALGDQLILYAVGRSGIWKLTLP